MHMTSRSRSLSSPRDRQFMRYTSILPSERPVYHRSIHKLSTPQLKVSDATSQHRPTCRPCSQRPVSSISASSQEDYHILGTILRHKRHVSITTTIINLDHAIMVYRVWSPHYHGGLQLSICHSGTFKQITKHVNQSAQQRFSTVVHGFLCGLEERIEVQAMTEGYEILLRSLVSRQARTQGMR